MSHNACFVAQEATPSLLRIATLCGECYAEICEGDTVYYDMEHYRYLCECCKERLCSIMDEETCEIVREEEEPSLFCS